MNDTGQSAAPRSRWRSMVAAAVGVANALCAVVPYALIALLIRFLMARVFFLSGQSMIEGPSVPLDFKNFVFSVTLPAQVKSATFDLFHTKYAAVPLPPDFSAYFVSYAAFFLPILLVIGFATRISAAILFIMTVLIQLYVLPDALWTVHAYWGLLLLVLMSVGPGAISIDHVIRFFAGK